VAKKEAREVAAASTRQSVLARARDGDWVDFLRIYPPLIQAFARRRGLDAADAEDVVQQTLTDVVRRLPEFEYDQQKRGFRAFLKTLVHRKVVDTLRRRRPHEPEQLLATSPAGAATPDELFDRQWLLEHLRRALEIARREVAPKTYQSFELYVLHEWPVEEIASFLKLSPNQVYTYKRRMIRRLRELLEEVQV
jgi:RNA polymerase sigma-70 factor (ECF subfamily)